MSVFSRRKRGRTLTNKNHIAVIEKDGLRAKGKTESLRHLVGERLTHKQAIYAKCYDCMGYFIDGRVDCQLFECSLYPFMVYRNTD